MKIKSILKYGALWGVLEVTLGFTLHLLNSSLAGAILIPIGVLFMWASYKSTGRWWSIPLTGAVAAVVRLAAYAAINGGCCEEGIFPTLAIVIESIAFIAPVIYLEHEKRKDYHLFVFKPIFLFYLSIVVYMIVFKWVTAFIKWGDINTLLAEADIKRELTMLFLDTLISSALIGIAIVLKEIFLLLMFRKSG